MYGFAAAFLNLKLKLTSLETGAVHLRINISANKINDLSIT